MKRILMAAAMTVASISAFAGTDVGVSVNIGQPGFYGRVDVGNMPPPPGAVVYAQPMIIEQGPAVVQRRPIYLRVPPAHQKDWRRYCSRYAACGQPVYFVRDDYYHSHYERHDHDRDHDRDRRHDDHHDDHNKGKKKHGDHDD